MGREYSHGTLVSRGLLDEESHYIWQNVTSTPLPCIRSSHYIIHTINKFFCRFMSLPCGDADNLNVFQEAVDLITDRTFVQSVNKRQVYNWTRCTMLVTPLRVPDRNSLCNSVSVYMLGVSDQASFFQKCLKQTCDKHCDFDSPFAKRWRYDKKKRHDKFGHNYNEENLRKIWSEVCHLLSFESDGGKSSSSTYSSHIRFYIFILAHICRRTIVVVALEEKDFKSSVFIPVLIPAQECVRCFIYLAFCDGHFAPLVYCENSQPGKKIRDPCVPIMDSNFELFQFPYLLEDEDGLSLLQLYAHKTSIGYATSSDIKEVTALRSPNDEFSTNCNELGPDPDRIIRACFDVLKQGGKPTDVQSRWNTSSELKIERNDELEDVESNYLSHAPQSMRGSFQPECDEEDEDVQDSGSISNFHRSFSNTASIVEAQYQEVSVNPSLEISPQEHSLSNVFSNFNHLGDTNVSPYLDSAIVLEPNTGSGAPINQEVISSSCQNLSDIEHEGSAYGQINNQSSSLHRVQHDQEMTQSFDRLPSLPNAVDDARRSRFPVHSDIIKVSNCSGINRATFRLESRRHKKIVELTLEKNSNNEVTLSIRKPNDIDIIYERTLGEDLEAELKDISNNYFRLCIALPEFVIPQQSSQLDFASGMAPVDEEDPAFVTLEDHPNKCRTDGCNGRGVRHHRNLCDSCYQAWNETLERRRQETSGSFSYLDSLSSAGSLFINGKCKTRNCNNPGLERCYGYCEPCFCAPGN